jgi:hypothetical protein
MNKLQHDSAVIKTQDSGLKKAPSSNSRQQKVVNVLLDTAGPNSSSRPSTVRMTHLCGKTPPRLGHLALASEVPEEPYHRLLFIVNPDSSHKGNPPWRLAKAEIEGATMIEQYNAM